MQQLAREVLRYQVDSWLENVVAEVLESSDTLKLERRELWNFLDRLPVAVLISTDQTCTNIVGNNAAQALLKTPHGRNLSQSAPPTELPPFKVFSNDQEIGPDDLPMQRAARTGERVNRSECEIRFATGGRIFIAGHCIPIQNERGEVCGSIGAFVDVTAQRIQLDQADIMAREMVHRVKNTVSIIQSLAHSTIKSQISPAEFAKFEGRLITIATAQDLVADSFVDVELGALAAGVLGPVVHALREHITLDGPAVSITSDHATSLSMIFHELATNACKYGSLSNGAGTISVRWTLPSPELHQLLSVEWIESGGPTSKKPERSGFGTKLINRLVRSLPNGKIARDYSDEGLKVRLDFSIASTIHDVEAVVS